MLKVQLDNLVKALKHFVVFITYLFSPRLSVRHSNSKIQDIFPYTSCKLFVSTGSTSLILMCLLTKTHSSWDHDLYTTVYYYMVRIYWSHSTISFFISALMHGAQLLISDREARVVGDLLLHLVRNKLFRSRSHVRHTQLMTSKST